MEDVVVGVRLPAETVKALRDANELEKVLTFLAGTGSGAHRTVHDVVRAVAAGVKGVACELTIDTRSVASGSTLPVPTPATTVPETAGTWGMQSSHEIRIHIFDDEDAVTDYETLHMPASSHLGDVIGRYANLRGHSVKGLTFMVPGVVGSVDMDHDAYYSTLSQVSLQDLLPNYMLTLREARDLQPRPLHRE